MLNWRTAVSGILPADRRGYFRSRPRSPALPVISPIKDRAFFLSRTAADGPNLWPVIEPCPCRRSPLRSTVITVSSARTRALTPADPFTTSSSYLIHGIWVADHSVSNHLRLSISRYPLPPIALSDELSLAG